MVNMKKYQEKRGKIGKYKYYGKAENSYFQEGDIIRKMRNFKLEKKGLKKEGNMIVIKF